MRSVGNSRSPFRVLTLCLEGQGLPFFANFAASYLTALAGHAGIAQFALDAEAAR